ncbi:MAG TPA: hypothetical protein VFX06_11000 [Stellaceae bacterium]|jgi:hypothetical protein|nr:hypothetical protein [Stellaceae bacterium]
MEDEGFVDDEFIEATARDCVARHGAESVIILRKRAEIAEVTGDSLSAHAWDHMAEVAEDILFGLL